MPERPQDTPIDLLNPAAAQILTAVMVDTKSECETTGEEAYAAVAA